MKRILTIGLSIALLSLKLTAMELETSPEVQKLTPFEKAIVENRVNAVKEMLAEEWNNPELVTIQARTFAMERPEIEKLIADYDALKKPTNTEFEFQDALTTPSGGSPTPIPNPQADDRLKEEAEAKLPLTPQSGKKAPQPQQRRSLGKWIAIGGTGIGLGYVVKYIIDRFKTKKTIQAKPAKTGKPIRSPLT